MNKIIKLIENMKEQKFLEGERQYIDESLEKQNFASHFDEKYQLLLKMEVELSKREQTLKQSCNDNHVYLVLLHSTLKSETISMYNGQCLVCGSYNNMDSNQLMIKISSKYFDDYIETEGQYHLYMLVRYVFEILLYKYGLHEKDLEKIISMTEKIINHFINLKDNIDLLFSSNIFIEDIAKTISHQVKIK